MSNKHPILFISITIAHCIDDFGGKESGYQIGALCEPYIQGDNCGQDVEYRAISTVTVHPNFVCDGSYDYDFALVRLVAPVSITPVNIDDGTYSPNYANGKPNLWPIGFGSVISSDDANLLPIGFGNVKSFDDDDSLYLDDDDYLYLDDDYYPTELKHVEVKYIDNASCESMYADIADSNITENMMCAADPNQDACQGKLKSNGRVTLL